MEIDILNKIKKSNELHRRNCGVQLIYKFPNGYGASVICHTFSYGSETGLLELAVLNKNGEIDYDTPITNDVEGYLTADEASKLLAQIEGLKQQ